MKPGTVADFDLFSAFPHAQKELLEKFGESMGKATNKHSPNETSWIDSVKQFFEDMKS